MAATGVGAAVFAGETLSLAGAAGAVAPDAWAQLRMCESSGNYATNTGNGYYGAYQFNLATWQGLGYTGLPSNAAPAVQDAAAQKLYNARGWQPWPACSAKLGLVDDRQASRDASRPPLAPVTPPAQPTQTPQPTQRTQPVKPTPTAVPVVAVSTPAPAAGSSNWDGHYLSIRDVGAVRADVKAWQAQMNSVGYKLDVDGRYGAKSAAAATQFEIDHHLSVERPGVVGPQVWGALFGK